MFFRLLILFIVIPLTELALLIRIGQEIGLLYTLLIVIATGVIGAYLAQTEGIITFRRIQQELHEGRIPTDSLLDGFLILIGGLLLLTPGFITDTIGFLILFPFSRSYLKHYLRRRFANKFKSDRVYTSYTIEDDI